jgi:hypothetical protein
VRSRIWGTAPEVGLTTRTGAYMARELFNRADGVGSEDLAFAVDTTGNQGLPGCIRASCGS